MDVRRAVPVGGLPEVEQCADHPHRHEPPPLLHCLRPADVVDHDRLELARLIVRYVESQDALRPHSAGRDAGPRRNDEAPRPA